MNGSRHLCSPPSVAGVGKSLVEAEMDDNRSESKGTHARRLGQRGAMQLWKQSQLQDLGRRQRQMEGGGRIESVAMLSHVAKLWSSLTRS